MESLKTYKAATQSRIGFLSNRKVVLLDELKQVDAERDKEFAKLALIESLEQESKASDEPHEG